MQMLEANDCTFPVPDYPFKDENACSNVRKWQDRLQEDVVSGNNAFVISNVKLLHLLVFFYVL